MNPRISLRTVLNLRFLLPLAAALAVSSVPAQTVPFYINDAVVQAPPGIPPQIDALNFVNNGTFNIQSLFSSLPYATANTVNFTNRGTMAGSSGFSFMTQPDFGGAVQANSFYNSGIIYSGSDSFLTFLLTGWSALPQTRINARTVLNPGTIRMGSSTLLSVTGENVDLNRATLLMSSTIGDFSDTNFFFPRAITSGGMYDSYWGMNMVALNPGFEFSTFFPRTPLHWVTNRYGVGLGTNFASQTAIYLPEYNFYVKQELVGSNVWTYGVFLHQSDPTITNAVRMIPQAGVISVEWSWPGVDPANGTPMTNRFYLYDAFGSISNLIVITNGYVDAIPTFIPTNYYFLSYQPIFGTDAAIADPGPYFRDLRVTNDYAAYQLLLLPNTVIPGETYGSTVENLPGRVELSASSVLNLTRSRISADNTISLKATNHFIGTRADLSAPFINLDLTTTNGSLAISNLIAPSMARPTGTISLFTTRWTDVRPDGYTNNYVVLFVNSQLQPAASLQENQVKLVSPNVFISDYLNISSNLLITATNLTLTTNAPGTPAAYGALVIQPESVFFPSALPLLQNLTNYGFISQPNATLFTGMRTAPWYGSTFTEPYKSMVNAGRIYNQGMQIRVEDMVNSGLLDAGVGNIELYSRNAYLSGGTMNSSAGDVTLLATNVMTVSNLTLSIGRTLHLSAGTSLDDGSLTVPVARLTNRNFWAVGRGFDLTRLPAVSSLLGTSVTNTAPAYQQVPNAWAGLDKGTNLAGYQNNAALGRLVLVGGTNSSFGFAGTGTSNAIYVDRLELVGFAGAKDVDNDLVALDIANNMRIYYAEALVNGVSQAEKINGHNAGRLIWVNAYAGYFSSTNIVYPNGTTNAVNSALAASCNLDSDHDGLVNCIDPTPVTVPGFCTVSLSSSNAAYAFDGGTGNFSVQDTSFCGYTVFSSNTWLTVTGGSSGNGFGQVSYRVATNTTSVTRTGILHIGSATFTVTQSAGGWVTSPIFGQLYYAGDGWYGSSAYGWMWFSGSTWVWSTSLQGWLGLNGNATPLWSPQFRWLTPSTSDPYQANTSTLGLIYVGQYNGAQIPEGWVVSPRFGYVWAAGDGTWFYSDQYGWLGVTPDGGIWSVNQNRFL